MESTKTLEIVIPTYNHPSFIEYILEQYEKFFEEFDFTVSIHDSSTDDLTEKLVRNHARFDRQVLYYRYPSEMDVDEKTIRSIKASTHDYTILCGDGWIINVASVLQSDYIKHDYDMILVYDKKVKVFADYFNQYIKNGGQRETHYETVTDEYLKNHYWHSTLYGASVISKRLYSEMDAEAIIEEFNHTNFIYPASLVITLGSIQGDVFVTSDDFLIRNSKKNSRKASEQTDVIKIWCKNYSNSVEKLRGIIGDEVANHIIKTTGARTGLLTANSLAGLKVVKHLNWKIYKEYKPYILRTIACSKSKLKLILCTPRFILYIMKWLRRGIKKMLGKGLDYKS